MLLLSPCGYFKPRRILQKTPPYPASTRDQSTPVPQNFFHPKHFFSLKMNKMNGLDFFYTGSIGEPNETLDPDFFTLNILN